MPELSSFPTRRSSDLAAGVAVLGGERLGRGRRGRRLDRELEVVGVGVGLDQQRAAAERARVGGVVALGDDQVGQQDRKSTRLNSSHPVNSYAVSCSKT